MNKKKVEAILKIIQQAEVELLERIKTNASKDCDALNADYGSWLLTELNRELKTLATKDRAGRGEASPHTRRNE